MYFQKRNIFEFKHDSRPVKDKLKEVQTQSCQVETECSLFLEQLKDLKLTAKRQQKSSHWYGGLQNIDEKGSC